MDSSSQFIVPTIIDVPELIVTNEDIDFEEAINSRGNLWLNKLQFLANTLSYTVNIGNIIRFPSLCYRHGGGAFLFAYTIMLIIVGLPLFLMELAFGQYANEGPITIWRISPAFEGLGYSMCLISAMVAIYYNIINSWILHYFFGSLTFSDLSWTKCDNKWNSAQCFLKPDKPMVRPAMNCSSQIKLNTSETLNPLNGNDSILIIANCSEKTGPFGGETIINSTDEVTLPANEYFHNNVVSITISITDIGSFNWDLMFGSMVVWSIVFIVIFKGFRLWNRLLLSTFIMPYLTLTALLIRAIFLPGSEVGIAYYFTPEWNRLQNIDVWADACTQIFFSISPCWGGVITLANMNKFHNNFLADTLLIVIINFATSIYSGLITFSILGYMSSYSGIPITAVTDAGMGFIFMVYTEGLAQMPLPNINSLLFFTILLFVGFTSQLTVIETVLTTIVNTWPHKLRYRKPLILMISCATMFILSTFMCFGNGFYVVQLMDTFSATFTAMIVAILELIAIAWVYGMENFMQDIDDMISVHRNLFPSRQYWYFMWRYLTPSALFAILLFCFTDFQPAIYRDAKNPPWTLSLGWFLTLASLSIIPAVAFIRFLLSPSGSFMDKISYLCRPSEDWAPSSYVSGPKLLNRHMMDDRDYDDPLARYTSQQAVPTYEDHDHESNDSYEDDPKVVDGRANYIIPEEEDDTDIGLITNETNV